PVQFSHAVRQAKPANVAGRYLPPWRARRSSLGGSVQPPPPVAPARLVPIPAGSSPWPSRTQTHASSRPPLPFLPALGLPAPRGGADSLGRQKYKPKPG